MIYFFQNGKVVKMRDISNFKDGETYFLLTEIDELPAIHRPELEKGKIWDVNYTAIQFSNQMEGFFNKLRTQEVTEEEIKNIKEVFSTQKIRFAQLLTTGDLKITDDRCFHYYE
jgi:hypothetical protein